MPAIPGMPPARFFIWLASSSSTRRDTSFTAARIKSCSISWSLLAKTSGSMRMSTICFWPFIFTVTMPPPAEASTATEFTCRCRSSCTCRSRESICWIALTSIRIPLGAASLRRSFLQSEAAPRGILMEVNAIQQMLSRLRQVQEDLQRQVNSVAVEASAGGGMVTVKMNGQKQIVDIRIEPDVFASKDQEMLQDLIRAAVNEASRRVDEELANQMKNLAGGIPGMAGIKIPGLF